MVSYASLGDMFVLSDAANALLYSSLPKAPLWNSVGLPEAAAAATPPSWAAGAVTAAAGAGADARKASSDGVFPTPPNGTD